MQGKRISHYRVLDVLGRGGMGVVYAAEDETLERPVALKFCSEQDPRGRRMLLAEAKSACVLVHPNIAQVYEFGETPEGEPFIAMELVHGESLLQRLQRGALPVGDAVRIAREVARALQHAHEHGILHRDIKPSNIRLTGKSAVKVVDFGLAQPLETAAARDGGATRTMEGFMRGTPAYMAPEQTRGEALDARSDLYSLGVVLYQCLTGSSPFAAPTAADTIVKVVSVVPPPPSHLNPAVGSDLDRVVMKAIAKDPDDRFQSAAEMLAAFDDPRSEERPRIPVRVQRRAWKIAGIALALLVAGAAWVRLRAPEEAPEAAMTWYRQGVASLADGTYHKATKLFSSAIEKDPKFVMAHARLADAWNELEDDERAQKEVIAADAANSGRRKVRGEDALRLDAIRQRVIGRYAPAAEIYRKLASDAKGSERADADIELGRSLERTDTFKDALDAYLAAIKANPQSAAAYLRAGAMYIRRGDRDKALEALSRAEQLYNVASNLEGIAWCLYHRGRAVSEGTQSLAILDKASKLAVAADNSQQTVKILLLESDRYVQLGQQEAGDKCANEAVQIANQNGLENMLARALIDVGISRRGRPNSDSIALYQQSIAIARRKGARLIEARALVNMGSLLIASLDPAKVKEGEDAVRKALAVYEPGGYSNETVACRALLAQVEQERGNYDAAAAEAQHAIDAVGNRTASRQYGWAAESLASIYRAQQKFPAALEWYRRSHDSYTAVNYAAGVAISAGHMAEMAADLGRAEEAEKYLDEARSVPGLTDNAEVRDELTRLEAWTRFALGQYAALKNSLRMAPGGEADADRAERTMTLALVLARSGEGGQAYDQAGRAERFAAASGRDELKALSAAVMTEAALASGRKDEVRPAAERALRYFERVPAHGTAFELWSEIACAESAAASKAAGEKAMDHFRLLTAEWSPEDVRRYSARPEVRRLLAAAQSAAKG